MDQEPTQANVAQPSTRPTAPRSGNSSRMLNAVLGIALALAVGGVGFAAGRLTAPAATFPNGLGPGGQVFNGNGGNGNGRPGGGQFSGGVSIEGTVESVTATTMTIKTTAGQTMQIAINGSTTYHSQADATSTDVATGGKVIVRLDVGSFAGGPNASPGTGGGAAASEVTIVP